MKLKLENNEKEKKSSERKAVFGGRWPVGRAARPLPFGWSQGRGWELEGEVSGLCPLVIHYRRATDTGQGSDFTFRGLWHALP